MITPRFSCTQTDAAVVISIYCPSIRASEVDITVEHNLVAVHVNPYFLRLTFSGRLLSDDDASTAAYDASSGYLMVTVTKESKGQEFKDLDLLAKLLAPRAQAENVHQPVIEVLASDENDKEEKDQDELVDGVGRLSLDLDAERKAILEAAENDWQLPQSIPESDPLTALHTTKNKSYGFLDAYSGYFTHVAHTANEVNELEADAETISPVERRKRRTAHENAKWDEEHYMADFADDEYIQELLHWTHPHVNVDTTSFVYTESENLAMLRLPRKEYLASPEQTESLYLVLLTILFSYVYDARTTQHDPTPESAWTICTLTPAFSALDPPPYAPHRPHSSDSSLPLSTSSSNRDSTVRPANGSLEFAATTLTSTLAVSYRRALAFPLYRSFALAEACRADTAALLSRGRRTVARCLLEVRAILDVHDVYYVYSRVWLDDLLVWVLAHTSDEGLEAFGRSVKDAPMEKRMVGWDLDGLEEVVHAAQEEERDSDSDDESEED